MQKFLFITLLSMCSFLNYAQSEFKEGVDYKIVNSKASSPSITEYFSLYCNHCYSFDPTFKELTNKFKTTDVEIVKKHVSFIGGENGKRLQKAHITARLLDVEDKFIANAFNQIHNKRNYLESDAAVYDIFKNIGIKKEVYNTTMQSFMTLGESNTIDEELKSGKINGVPAVVINNKYMINFSELNSDDASEKLYELTKHLLTLN